MAPNDLLELLNRHPFLPLSLWVSDGSGYHIDVDTYAEMHLTTLWIGLEPDESGVPLRTVYVDTRHISRVEVERTQKE